MKSATRLSDKLIDIIRGQGFGGLEAIEEANRCIREANASDKPSTTYHVGKVSFTLKKKKGK